MAAFTFFFHPMSRSQIARWALHEAGADYEPVRVDWGLVFKSYPERASFSAYVERMRGRPAYQEAKAIDNKLIAEMRANA